jgi:hypothetical protein
MPQYTTPFALQAAWIRLCGARRMAMAGVQESTA